MRINYNCYRYSIKEYIHYGTLSFITIWIILMLFYNHFAMCLLLGIPTSIGFMKYYKAHRIHQRRRILMISFKDFMEALVSALSAGYSMENAVHEVKKDLMLIYPEKSLILCETRYILQQVSLDVGLDVLFTDLGERSGCEDIIDFACIYATVKRTGGNLITVMKQTAQNISDKIEIKREIDTLISGKKLEAKFMCMIPIFMILYLRIFSPGFIDPLYEGFTGRLLMTAALIIYAGSAFWIRKVISIERI